MTMSCQYNQYPQGFPYSYGQPQGQAQGRKKRQASGNAFPIFPTGLPPILNNSSTNSSDLNQTMPGE